MSAFTPSGVEFVAKNLSGYLSDLSRVDKAQQALGKSAQSVGSQFAGAHTGASSFASRIGSMIPGVGGLASALGGVATVAGGIVAAQVFNKIVEGVGAFVSVGLSAVDAAQRLETGLGALLTMNNLYERTTETLTVATMSASEWAEAQTEAAKKSDDLAFKQRELTAEINTQNASIQEQRQRIIQMADGLDKNQQVARLAEMELALEGMTRELAETSTEQGKLNNLTQEYTTVTETSFKQVRGFAEAQELAAKQSKDLLHFVEKLAIVSPFEQDQVAIVAKLATAAGLGVETTKNFTAGFLDLASAVGIGSDGLTFAADQLLQVAKIGKITTVDLRQLRRLGIDLEKIIGTQMGMSIEQFNAEAGKSPEIFNKLFEAVTEFSQNTFAGTAEKMATSLSGLRSTFSDIFSVGSKNLLRPLVEAVGPMASEMLGRLSDMVTGPEMAKIGEAIPRVLFGAFQSLSGEGEGGLFSGLKGLGLSSSLALEITNITKMIGEMGARIKEAFSAGGIRGAFSELGVILGEVWTGNIQPLASQKITELVAFISQTFSDKWPTIQETLTGWGDKFWDWIQTNVTPKISEKLTQLVTSLSTFLKDNWPTIQTSLNEWAGKFFDWVAQAVSDLNSKLAPILTAFADWARSPETQAKLNQLGTDLINAVFTSISNAASNTDNAAKALTAIGKGLLAGVTAITATLILVGAQIVAGIYSGILEHLGIDLQPATVQELGNILKQIGDDSITIAKELGRRLVKAINDGLIAALRLGMELGKEIRKKIEDAKKAIDVGEWLTLGGDLMDGLLEGIKKNSAQVLEFLKDLAWDSLASLKGIWMSSSPSRAFAIEGKNAVDGLVKGAMDNAAQVPRTFGNLGQSAINSLMTGMTVTDPGFIHDFIDDLNMGGIGKAAGAGGGQWKNFRNILKNEITAGMSGLEAGSIDFMSKITEVANRFHFPPNLAREFAQAEGLVKHLTGTFSVMWQKMRIENLSTSISLASQFAGIGASFADMVKEMSGGFQEAKEEAGKLTEKNTGLTATLDEQKNKMAILREDLSKLTTGQGQNAMAVERVTESLAFGERQMAIYRQELETLRQDEQGNALDIEKKVLAMDRLTETMDMQRQELAKLQAANDSDALAIENKTLAIEELTAEIAKNQQAIEQNKKALADYRKELERKAFAGFSPFATETDEVQSQLAMIEMLKEFLAGSGEEFRIIGEELGGIFAGSGLTSDIIHNRLSAQEELNRLLAEQARREQEILDLEKAQKQLDFLGQQLNLMKMLSDRGLNPRDILGGITLGVNASAQDLLEATNRVVTAMVNQINADLQIASPSKVMARIGRRVVEGMAMGLEGGRSLLDRAIGSTPLLNGSLMRPLPQPAYAGGGDTYNYEFPMTVHTTASAQATIRQYEVKRSMYAS